LTCYCSATEGVSRSSSSSEKPDAKMEPAQLITSLLEYLELMDTDRR
jgi:hypothetical protein